MLDIGGVFYLSHACRAFFERWSMRRGMKCIEAAQALGFRTVLFHDTQQTIDALQPGLAPG